MTREAGLVAGLMHALRQLPGFVVIKHHDPITAGVPDISATGRGRTTWLEVKYANPNIIDRAVQRALMQRLARVGSAFYVVYRSSGIIDIISPHPNRVVLVTTITSHDHHAVARFVQELHK